MGKSFGQIVYTVISNTPVEFTCRAPDDFVALAQTCLNVNYEKRPSFGDLVPQLQALIPEERAAGRHVVL